MTFEWDEQKRAANLEKHGVDFELAKLMFDGPVMECPDSRREYDEDRIGAYGLANGVLLFAVYTWRGGNRRIISARKAGTEERRRYDAAIAGRRRGE